MLNSVALFARGELKEVASKTKKQGVFFCTTAGMFAETENYFGLYDIFSKIPRFVVLECNMRYSKFQKNYDQRLVTFELGNVNLICIFEPIRKNF